MRLLIRIVKFKNRLKPSHNLLNSSSKIQNTGELSSNKIKTSKKIRSFIENLIADQFLVQKVKSQSQ